MDTLILFVIVFVGGAIVLPLLAALSERRYRERERKEIATFKQQRRWTQWGCYDGSEHRSARKE